jgi:hypothetical protein
MDQLVCHCGEKAVGLISGKGWLCKECFNAEVSKTNNIKSKKAQYIVTLE